MKNPELSIIVLSYNTQNLLSDCLESLGKLRDEINFEVIVVDNGSVDGSIEMVEKKFPWVILIRNNANLGFARGNNSARKAAKGKYVLFLNSDTIVPKGTLGETVKFLGENSGVGAVTCKLVLPSGALDKDARRSFPTPWVSLTHFSGLDRVFPRSKLFAQYWYGFRSEEIKQEVDVIQGAYFLTYKKVLDEVGWFSEEYFLDGEDIDLCWKIKSKGYKIYYYPKVSILHLKGASKGKKSAKEYVPLSSRLKFRMASVNSMEIFYRKWLWSKYPLPLNWLVIFGIRILKFLRFIKALFS